MRHQSILVSLVFVLCIFISPGRALCQATQPTPPNLPISAVPNPNASATECSPHYNGRYPDNRCFVEIKRDSPASPQAVTVPRKTDVIVRIKNTRALETIAFDEKTSRIDKPDAFSTFVQSALDPIKSFVFKLVSHPGGGSALRGDFVYEDDPLYIRQKDVQAKIDLVRTAVTAAARELSCLSSYQGQSSDGACDPQKPLNPTSFGLAKQATICDIQGGTGCASNALDAATKPLPIATEQATAGQITKEIGDIAKGTVDIPADKGSFYDALLSNEQRLQSQIKDLQDAQKILLQGSSILLSLPAAVDTEIVRTQEHDTATTITVTATGQINKAVTQLGSISITWQTTPWKVSTGILFSGLPNNTFANSPRIVGGQPILDSGGKVTTVVTEATTRPDNVFPLVMLDKRLKEFRSCSRACGFYASGGVGVSLANSSTEFAVGPSFQWGVILISGLVHVGRVQYLTNGVQVGQMLGSSPPALPTEKRWSVSGGLGISYIIPFK